MSLKCPKCRSKNVVPDYGFDFYRNDEPTTMPYNCLDCGIEWGGNNEPEHRDARPLIGIFVLSILGWVWFYLEYLQ